ncbi:MAG TPA: class I SAM-dependent methyltransferase [Bryobacteraceae bacterium]|jgi:ubiquinone/menaquinone biosynthesis C-methylase UbiE|nr:class I SAM-dependent methyltransferase [Bryobacteraceae bacterium]
MLAAERQRFVEDYLRIRRAEGRGSDDPAYYWELPYRDLTGRLAAQWEMRGRTYRYFEQRVLTRMEREASRPLEVLDLGAGTGWMCYRLALRGHRPVALDLLNDDRDGLGAARHFFTKLQSEFPRMQAEFDQLPFPGTRFDAVIYNASLHYSSDYLRTLVEARRVLRAGGRIVVLDSPVYKLRKHGEMMRREKHAQFLAQFGTESDHVGSIEYLDESMLDELARELNVTWRIHRPWYGMAWHLRPWRARLKGARPPSRFWILEGKLNP